MIAAKKKDAPEVEARKIPVADIVESPLNPRKTFDDAKIAELAESMKAQGQLQPIVVRPMRNEAGLDGRYELAIGTRRTRAAKLAGITHLLAIVRDLSDAEMRVIGCAENKEREELNAVEEADAYLALCREEGWSEDRIADAVGKPVARVRRRLRLASLCDEGRDLVTRGILLPGAATVVARLEHQEDQAWVLSQVVPALEEGEEIRAQDVEHYIARRMRRLSSAPFKIVDASLTDAGACTKCPKSTAAQAALFDEGPVDDAMCTDGDCWSEKVAAHSEQIVGNARGLGLKVLSKEESKSLFPSSTYPANGYVALDAPCYYGHRPGSEPPTWKDVLGAKAPKPIIAYDTEGLAREVVKEADARKAGGFDRKQEPEADLDVDEEAAPAPTQREQAAEERKKDQVREDRVVAAIVERVEGIVQNGRDDEMAVLWRLVALLAVDLHVLGDVARRRVLKSETIAGIFKTSTAADHVAGLVVEALVAGPFEDGARREACDLLGIDKDEAEKGALPKPATPPKPAAKQKKPAKKPTKKAKGKKR